LRREVFRSGPWNVGLLAGINVVEAPLNGEVVVGSGEVMVTWYGKGVQDAPVRASGYAADHLNAGWDLTQAHFPAGGPDRWEVWLDGIGDSRVVLVRKPEPVVRVGYRRGAGDLAMTTEAELNLAPGPLSLEFFFDQPMLPGSLDKVLEETLKQSEYKRLPGIQTGWPAPDHARIDLPGVPARLDVALPWFQAATGLLAVPRALVLRSTEGAPFLEKVNLSTGARERVMTMPADMTAAVLSPDGKYVGVTARAKTPDNHPWWPFYVAVADIGAQRVTRVGDGTALGWRADTLIGSGTIEGWFFWDAATGGPAVKQTGRTQWGWATLSSDGRAAAFLDIEKAGRHSELDPTPVDLVVTDPTTGAERTRVTGFAHHHFSGKDGMDFSRWVAWSPDGQMLAVLDMGATWEVNDLVVFDLKVGERRVVRAGVAVRLMGTRLYWSPDGQNLLVASDGAAQVIPLVGGPLITLPGGRRDAAFWDAAGTRVLSATGEWAGVYVYWPGTGRRLDLGDGLPVGFDGEWAYVVRWPDSAHRYRYVGI
jgi:hypothetical protein